MTRQKGKFLTFLFSLVPGCGQMYLGFMKRGVSLMLLFAIPIIFTEVFYAGVFAVISVVVWFFSFFDAMNLNSMAPDLFQQVTDQILFVDSMPEAVKNSRVQTKYLGIGLIVLGAIGLWYTLTSFVFSWLFRLDENAYWAIRPIVDMIPVIVLAVAIIIIGIRLISGKKKEVLAQDATQ